MNIVILVAWNYKVVQHILKYYDSYILFIIYLLVKYAGLPNHI